MRKPNSSDRLMNVRGYSEDFLDAICNVIDDVDNPGYILCIGDQSHVKQLAENIVRARPDAPEKNWLATLPPREINGKLVPFSVASEECAYHLGDLVLGKNRVCDNGEQAYLGKIKAVVLFHQEGKEQFLTWLLKRCERLKVYRVLGNEPNGKMEVCPWENAVPQEVDLTATQHDDGHCLRSIPQEAMYGRCADLARQTHCPVGYAYIAAVTAASALIDGNCNIRPNIYSGLLGDVHTGKTLTANRTCMLLGLHDEHDNPTGSTLISSTPVSDRGLYKLLPEKEFVKRLIYGDEGRELLGKGNIQGSTLISVLCAMWSRNRGGVADKFGTQSLNVQLSLLLNFKIRDASEFPEIFTHATSHGLWDRFLFGILGNEKWHYTPWAFNAERDVFEIQPTKPEVPGKVFDAAHSWSAVGEDRDRLAELALRVAYVTSALDGDSMVGDKAITSALCLMEWQESIRKVFQPAKGANEYQECVNTVLAVFKSAGGAANWRDMNRKHHWYTKFRVLSKVKTDLMTEQILILDKTTGKHFLTGEEKSK